MSQGWIKLHRILQDKGYYTDSCFVHLWIHLLLIANHEEKEFMWNGSVMKIKAGQGITGRMKLSKATGINRSKIERILKTLENEQQIEQQATNKYRLITILNWDKHQAMDSKVSNKRATSEQQVSTNKKEKKEKNYNKREYLSNIPPEDVEMFITRFDMSKRQLFGKAEDLKIYCETKAKKYSNYRSFLLGAVRKDFKQKPKVKPIKREPEVKRTPAQQALIDEQVNKISRNFNVNKTKT